jgi:hypothetical protein
VGGIFDHLYRVCESDANNDTKEAERELASRFDSPKVSRPLWIAIMRGVSGAFGHTAPGKSKGGLSYLRTVLEAVMKNVCKPPSLQHLDPVDKELFTSATQETANILAANCRLAIKNGRSETGRYFFGNSKCVCFVTIHK